MSSLVEVGFLPAGRTCWVAAGTTLLQAGAAAGIEIVTGCTRGMCGTDAVRIVAGVESIEPPSADERGTLDRMGLGAEWRLACSARVRSGSLRIEIGAF
ncbi:MAG: 2Fe-2S iron-sulfur cluster-binding protein [Planctomycetota bacterium]